MCFEKNVFINCPFDNKHKRLLNPMMFVIMYLGYKPCLSESGDAGKQRIDEICEIIKNSQYSIHDISLVKSDSKDEIARFNMPFELGMDFSLKKFGGRKLKNKVFLILEAEEFISKKSLSDLAGCDFKSHKGRARDLVTIVRNWIYHFQRQEMISSTTLWDEYNQYCAAFKISCIENNIKVIDMPRAEFIELMKKWIETRLMRLD